MTAAPTLLLNVAAAWDGTDPAVIAEQAAAAGLDGIGLADSPRLFRDALVETGHVLERTSVSLAGACVASLGLRHPATVAGSLRTLEAHHPGRVFTVVGRGESSVRNEGLPVPPMADYLAALARLRELVEADGAPSFAGRLLGAASGPRTLGSTAAELGAVLVDVGVAPDVVARAVDLVRERHENCVVWLFVRAAVTGNEEEAAAAAEPTLGSCATRMAASPDWYGVAGAELAAVQELAGSHDYARHGTAQARSGRAGRADRSVRERFYLTGGAAEITGRLRPLAGLDIAGVVLAGAVPGVGARLPELAGAVRRGLTVGGAA